MTTIMVTGAGGFIGSHLTEQLLGQGDSVVGVDNFDDFYSRDIKETNLAKADSLKGFSLVEADIRDFSTIKAVFQKKKIDIVIHLAAKAGIGPSLADPLGCQDVNVRGTNVVLQAAGEAGIKNFIFASSSSVYGNNEKVPFHEDDRVDHPISPYAASKKAGELISHTYHHLYQMNVTCLRFFTVYGPRQRPDLAIHKFVRQIESGQAITMYGDGSMSRDFTYIDDVISGIMAATRHLGGYRVYNIGESRPIRLDELIARIESALGRKAAINQLPTPAGDVRRTFADVSKAERELGYRPQTLISDGLNRFVQWYRTQRTDKR